MRVIVLVEVLITDRIFPISLPIVTVLVDSIVRVFPMFFNMLANDVDVTVNDLK
jgi:hypothetical protein